MSPIEVGTAIREWRERAGLTQDGLGDLLRVDADVIDQWEWGEARPDTNQAGILADILGAPPNKFSPEEIMVDLRPTEPAPSMASVGFAVELIPAASMIDVLPAKSDGDQDEDQHCRRWAVAAAPQAFLGDSGDLRDRPRRTCGWCRHQCRPRPRSCGADHHPRWESEPRRGAGEPDCGGDAPGSRRPTAGSTRRAHGASRRSRDPAHRRDGASRPGPGRSRRCSDRSDHRFDRARSTSSRLRSSPRGERAVAEGHRVLQRRLGHRAGRADLQRRWLPGVDDLRAGHAGSEGVGGDVLPNRAERGRLPRPVEAGGRRRSRVGQPNVGACGRDRLGRRRLGGRTRRMAGCGDRRRRGRIRSTVVQTALHGRFL